MIRIDALPQELLCSIFKQLPVCSLVECQLVCRKWCWLLSFPQVPGVWGTISFDSHSIERTLRIRWRDEQSYVFKRLEGFSRWIVQRSTSGGIEKLHLSFQNDVSGLTRQETLLACSLPLLSGLLSSRPATRLPITIELHGARFITKWESMLHDGFIHQIARHLHGLVLVQLDNLATYNFEPLGQLTNLENLYISAKDRRRVDYDVPEGSESDALLYLGALSKLKTLSLLVGYHSGFIDWKVSKLSRLRGSLTCLELGGAADCLTQLPNLAALRRLSLWYADDAGLQTLTTDIHTLSSLTSLTISNCAIKGCWSLHALAKMPYLQRLDLCSVYVKGSSTEARGLLSLPCSTTELVLEAAPEMVDLEHFAQLPRLAKLQLRRCKLSLFEIPDFQGAFSRLEALDLSKNAFSSMPDGLEQFSNLQILDLSCQLVGFQVSAPMDFVEKMPFLRRIDIHTAAARNSQDTWNSMSLFYIAAARDFALGRSRASGKGGTDILLTSAVSDNRDMNWAWGRSDSAHPGSPRYPDSPRYLPYSPSPSSSLE